MTIEQLQELVPELTPLQARLLLDSVAPKARTIRASVKRGFVLP
jgi:hypothetical protein